MADRFDTTETEVVNSSSEIHAPVSLSPRLIEALSSSGYLYSIVWPIVIEQVDDEQRDHCLSYVNHFFALHAKRVKSRLLSDEQKAIYRERHSEHRPLQLDLESLKDVEVTSWGGNGISFNSIDNFRAFCALGDIDPDSGTQFDLFPETSASLPENRFLMWTFVSRTRDVAFDISQNPEVEKSTFAHYFGITGRVTKLERMYRFVENDGHWNKLVWGGRGYTLRMSFD
ncbi:hypothetical protein A7U60_g6269 [Sanghuangporus baumii]|uniref:Uncharacterized protein n=1 Tax=Sanghuangporus baumii TaxID=108892 RepID=A0A9Q5HV58_SANBA|nr:hypothetical protein A7U60_g6269 [Sanghuangporus baumii]